MVRAKQNGPDTAIRDKREKFMSFVELRGGLTVPEEALTTAFGLLNQGLELRQEGELLRVSGPNGSRPTLDPETRAAISKWKLHILALMAYRAPEE